mgnify:CR=1 FL=1
MKSVPEYRPIPWFLPAIAALIVLSVLFWFGLQEQQYLLNKSIEETIKQRLSTAEHVARQIETALQRTKDSADRLAMYLSSALSSYPHDTSPQFEILFEKFPDNTIRSIKKNYDANTQAGVWIPAHHLINKQNKTQIVKAKYSIEAYGLGAKQQPYVDTWFMPKKGGIVIYWPDEENFIYQAKSDFNYKDTQWMAPARPENNPQKKSYWTNLSLDPIPHIWMLSAVAPLYFGEKWQGTVGHDIPLEHILTNTNLLNKQENSRFILVTEEQYVVASDIYAKELKSLAGNIKVKQLSDDRWNKAITLAHKENVVNEQHTSYQIEGELFTISYISEQNWLLITSMPLSPITQETKSSFKNLRNIAFASIFIEILVVSIIIAWGHRINLAYIGELTSIHAELKQRKERYKNLVENVPSIVYQCQNNKSWNMTFINGACHVITGYEVDELINNELISFADLIHPEDRDHVWEKIQSALQSNEQYEVIFRISHKNGACHWVLERGQRAIDEQGKVYLEGVITDITQLKTAEFELQELNGELDFKVKERTSELITLNNTLNLQALELKSSFTELKQAQKRLIETEKMASLSNLVVGMAHELNTPLGNLQMLASILEDQFHDLQFHLTQKTLKQDLMSKFILASNKILSSINTNTQSMIVLSDSFKSIAIKDNEQKSQKFNLKEQVQSAVHTYRSELKNKSVKVAVNIPDDINIISQSATLYQVLTHLLVNSLSHGFENKKSGKINITAKYNQKEVFLRYCDDGDGIPESIQQNIFEPFTTNKRGAGSIGLGLNVVYNLIVEGLNGTIKYINKPIGAEFVINIPKERS